MTQEACAPLIATLPLEVNLTILFLIDYISGYRATVYCYINMQHEKIIV